MNPEQRILAIAALGRKLRESPPPPELLERVRLKNSWFTEDNVRYALSVWGETLHESNIREWLRPYHARLPQQLTNLKVGVINAGNIPLAGMHDLISVLLAGHLYIGKNPSDENSLLPYITSRLEDAEPRFGGRVSFPDRLSDFDAVIATGSNNSARYFESYFGKYPHIIRRNRNGVAVLFGNESASDLENLGHDIFQYFGLGCRNVSQVFVPEGYEFTGLFEAIYRYHPVMQHHKYMNNFDYNNTMFLMKQAPFLHNNFLIIREDDSAASPISVLHYRRYRNEAELINILDNIESAVQYVVSSKDLSLRSPLRHRVIRPGHTQQPALSDYADGVDTMQFLVSLPEKKS